MSAETEIFQLTVEEFFFLTQMLEISHIAGFKDPFQGYLMDELEEEFAIIKQRLLDRGLVVAKDDSDELVIDELLGLCLMSCGSGEAVYLKKNIKGSGEYEAYLNFTPNVVVERTWDDSGSLTLTPVSNAELSMNVLAGFFPLTLRGETPFLAALKNINGGTWDLLPVQEKEKYLHEQRMVPENINLLLRLESDPDRSGTMVFCSRYGGYWEEEVYLYRQLDKELLLITQPADNEIVIESYRPEPVLAALERLAEKFDLVREKGA
ncbi:hypothetical protein [Paenibacillus sp.]|jgi:hypothetical protein|uniref:hypothetical protein n=1 Tax=Paenibacillus sp. TaxID=58172 RepID=UPI00282159D5|nr:hypothetical protein [Paenibacillus sp.]MDR0268494.1 hypothetical protein [Paenibacillus sp.]